MPTNRPTTIAMLGCSGFIGSHLLERILQATDRPVIGVDRANSKISHLLHHPRLQFYPIDVHDSIAIRPILEQCGTVVSLAALCNPWLYTNSAVSVIESNFVGMYPIVRMCSELGCRLVHFSTSEVYGRTLSGCTGAARSLQQPGNGVLDENATPLILGPVHAQRWCYASAKQLLERTIYAYGVESRLDYTIIRPFNFIGPRMDFFPGIDGEGVPRVLACFMEALLRGTPLRLVDGGLSRRCFTAIGDAVDAVMLILQQPDVSRQRIFNIGNPANEISIADLAERMIELYRGFEVSAHKNTSRTETVSAREFYGEGYEDSDRRVPDIGAITGALGWRPVTGLDEALQIAMAGFITDYSGRLSSDAPVKG